MLVHKAYKFRLYPDQEQQKALAIQFGHARFVYNHFLQTRQEHYTSTGEGLYYHHTAIMLTRLKRDPDYTWLRDADSQVLQQKLRDLDRAFQIFLRDGLNTRATGIVERSSQSVIPSDSRWIWPAGACTYRKLAG